MIVECHCGKRYQVGEKSRGKRYACGQCGGVLEVPKISSPIEIDDDFEYQLAEDPKPSVLPDRAQALPKFQFMPPMAASSTARRKPLQTGKLVWCIVLATIFLSVCLYAYVTFTDAEVTRNIDFPSRITLSIMIIGFTGIVCLLIGARIVNPPPKRKPSNENRMHGVNRCISGIAMMVTGIGLSVASFIVSGRLEFGAAVVFVGMILGGFISVIAGLVSIVTGHKVE